MTTIKQILKVGRSYGATKKTPEMIAMRDAQIAARRERQAERDAKKATKVKACAMMHEPQYERIKNK